MGYKPKTYAESFAEITAFRTLPHIRYEVRMVAEQADNEIKNSTPNDKIQKLMDEYKDCGHQFPAFDGFMVKLKKLIEVSK